MNKIKKSNFTASATETTALAGASSVSNSSSVSKSSVTVSSAKASSVKASSVKASSGTASSGTASSGTASSGTASSGTASSATASSATASSATASSAAQSSSLKNRDPLFADRQADVSSEIPTVWSEASDRLLNVQGLTTRLASEAGWVHALDDLSLCIEKGQTWALVGESGCGKSMTALSIARLLPDCGAIVAGQIDLDETSLLTLSEQAMRRVRGKRIAMIFQEPGTSLNPVMTVGAQIVESIVLHHPETPRKQALEQAATWLTRVGLLDAKQRLSQYPFELSGGQKQRVMIAMALAIQPDLLIADEPTTALDVSTQAQVLELLKDLQQAHGMSMLLITHDLAIVRQMADHVGLMYAGQLVESAPVDEFFTRPSHPYAQALLKALPGAAQRGKLLNALPGRVPSLVSLPVGCRFASRCAHVESVCTQTNVRMQGLAQMPSHLVRCARVESVFELNDLPQSLPAEHLKSEKKALKPPVNAAKRNVKVSDSNRLHVEHLSVAYREKQGLLQTLLKPSDALKPVLHNLSFTLQKGQTIALVGESGSGKTTAVRALLGLLPDSAKVGGKVELNGQSILQSSSNSTNWRANIQFVFQDPFASLNPRHRIQDILLEPLQMLAPQLSDQVRVQRMHSVLDQVNLSSEILTRYPHEFSGGQRQRIAIARALMPQPQVLVCDEPTSALDVSVQAQILNLLQQLQQQTGVAILFITHNLAVVEYLADEVLVLQAGHVVERGQTAKVFKSPKHAYTRMLLKSVPRL